MSNESKDKHTLTELECSECGMVIDALTEDILEQTVYDVGWRMCDGEIFCSKECMKGSPSKKLTERDWNGG